MIVRSVVAVLVGLALVLSILELSSLAAERRRTTVVRPSVADVLRSSPPVASELDSGSGPELRPAVTF